MSIAGFFSFFQIGSGPYPPTPRNRGAGCQLESLPSSQWDPESRLGTCPSPSGAPPGSIPGDRLNLSDFLSAMRTNSRIWDPIGLNDPIARPQPLEMLICNSAIGNSNWGNWDPQFQFGQLANWQFNQIQFPRFNEGNSLIGFAASMRLSCGRLFWFVGEAQTPALAASPRWCRISATRANS